MHIDSLQPVCSMMTMSCIVSGYRPGRYAVKLGLAHLTHAIVRGGGRRGRWGSLAAAAPWPRGVIRDIAAIVKLCAVRWRSSLTAIVLAALHLLQLQLLPSGPSPSPLMNLHCSADVEQAPAAQQAVQMRTPHHAQAAVLPSTALLAGHTA